MSEETDRKYGGSIVVYILDIIHNWHVGRYSSLKKGKFLLLIYTI